MYAFHILFYLWQIQMMKLLIRKNVKKKKKIEPWIVCYFFKK